RPCLALLLPPQPTRPPFRTGLKTGAAAADDRSVAMSAAPTIGELLAPLSCTLDLGEGLRGGHAARTAVLAARIADAVGADPVTVLDPALLQDAGGPATAAGISALFHTDDRLAKRALREIDPVRRGRVLRGSLRLSRRGFLSVLGRGRELQALAGLKD